jgi:Flp pilus assembly protein TadG
MSGARALANDCRGVAATEFALIVPLLIVGLFGTIEISEVVAIDQRANMVASSLARMVTVSHSIDPTDFDARYLPGAKAIISPYDPTTLQATATEVYIDPSSLNATVQWSRGDAARNVGDIVTTLPPGMIVPGTYVIMGEASYSYTSPVLFFIPNGVALYEASFARPTNVVCVIFGSVADLTNAPPCPTS